MIDKNIVIDFTNSKGDKFSFTRTDEKHFQLNVPSGKLLLSERDVIDLSIVLHDVEKSYDSYKFSHLQCVIGKKVPEKLALLTDETLMDLAVYNDKHPPYYKRFTQQLRAELFKRNGLSKAGQKLTFNQKAFLFSHGLKRD